MSKTHSPSLKPSYTALLQNPRGSGEIPRAPGLLKPRVERGMSHLSLFCRESDGDDSSHERLTPIIVLSQVIRELDNPGDRWNPSELMSDSEGNHDDQA